MVKLRELMNILGKNFFDANLRDDPLSLGERYIFREEDKPTERDVTFLGKRTTLDNLLEFSGYRSIPVDIPTYSGKWEVYENDKNIIGLYVGTLPRSGYDSEPKPHSRFLVRTSKRNANIEKFVNDLNVITVNALENSEYRIHNVRSFFRISKLNPNYNLKFSDLSEESRNYDLMSTALNGLKSETFAKFIEYAIVPVGELKPEQCEEMGSVKQVNAGDAITLYAVPISPFKSPFSRFNEKGEIKGHIGGTFSGNFVGFFGLFGSMRGTINAEMSGSYSGSGEIKGIRKDTPIEWLMKDADGKQFVLWDYHLSDEVKAKLDELSMEDFSLYGDSKVKIYSEVMAEQLNKFSLNNSHLFYAEVLAHSQVPIAEREPMKIYGHVIQMGDLPLVQLIGFEDREGKKVLTQTYPVALLSKGMNTELKRLSDGKTSYVTPIEAPKL